MTPIVGGVAAALLVLALLGREALALAATPDGAAPSVVARRALDLVAVAAGVAFGAAVAAHLVALS